MRNIELMILVNGVTVEKYIEMVKSNLSNCEDAGDLYELCESILCDLKEGVVAFPSVVLQPIELDE